MIVMLLLAGVTLDLPALPDGECLEAGFTQTRTLPALSRPLTLKGRLRIERDNGLDWRILAPYQYRFAVRGATITETLPDGTSRVVDDAEAPWLRGMSEMFSAMLRGDEAGFTEWFEVIDTGSTEDGQRIRLAPANELVAQAMTAIDILHDDTHLRALRIEEAGGGTTAFAFDPLVHCETGETR